MQILHFYFSSSNPFLILTVCFGHNKKRIGLLRRDAKFCVLTCIKCYQIRFQFPNGERFLICHKLLTINDVNILNNV